MKPESLELLQEAVADVGYWRWWVTDEDACQVEFGGVQLYAAKDEEKAAHSAVIAARFTGHPRLVFFSDNDLEPDWHIRLQQDELEPFTIDHDCFQFQEVKLVKELETGFERQVTVKDNGGQDNTYLLAFRAGPVGVCVSGDMLQVLTHEGEITDDNIQELSGRWWEYWRHYWELRGSQGAYAEDYACEVTIPAG